MCEGSCCKTFSRIILIIINIIFFLAGALMLAFGIAVVAAPTKFFAFLTTLGLNFNDANNATNGFLGQLIQAVGIFMIILGGIVFIIAFFGFFGAACDNKCMIVTYVVLLIIILLAEIALIIFGAVYPTKFDNTGSTLLLNALQSEFNVDQFVPSGTVANGNNNTLYNTTSSTNAISWMAIQYQFSCCGATGNVTADYSSFSWTQFNCSTPGTCPPGKYVVPISCCTLNTNSIDEIPTNLNQFVNYQACLQTGSPAYTNTQGCFAAIQNDITDIVQEYGKIAIGIAAGIAGLELILIVFGITLACLMHRSDKYV